MANKIQIRRSATSGAVPTTSQLDLGELAINTKDGKLFLKTDDGSSNQAIIEVGKDADTLDGQEGSYYQNASNLNAGTIPDARISDIGDSAARIITLDNLEKGDLTSDGQLSFDSSQGLIVYRTQQGVNTAVTVLDGANVNAGANISISNIDAGATNTGSITFAVTQGSGSGLDADTVDGIQAGSFLRSNAADTFSGNLTGSSGANISLNSNVGAGGTTAFASMTGRLEFDNDYSDAARGPNKILLYHSDNWISGLAVHSSTTAYYTGTDHAWYKSNSPTSFTQVAHLDSSGNFVATGTCTATTFSGSGASLTTLNASNISSGTLNTARLPATYTKAARVTIQATGATNDVLIDAANNILLEAGEEEDGGIYFRGNGGNDSYRFAKSGQTAIEGFLSFESLTADRTYTFPDTAGTIALTSDIDFQAQNLLKSNQSDTFSGGTLTVDGGTGLALIAKSSTFGQQLEILRNHSTNAPGIKFSNTAGQKGILYADGSGVLRWRDLTSSNTHEIWHAGNDGPASGLDADTLDSQEGSYYLDYNNFTNTPSFTGSFDSLTGKTSGTGNYSTSGDIVSGRGSGGVALTINDGKGNANVTFNHQDGTPEQNGNAARIEVNCDSTSNANINFEVKSNVTGGTNVNLTSVFNMSETGATCLGNTVWHAGNDGSASGLDADTVDGIQATSFLRSDANDIFTGTLTIAGTIDNSSTGGSSGAILGNLEVGYGAAYNSVSAQSNNNLYLNYTSTGPVYIGSAQHTVWHSGNDGSASGLDADTVDGIEAANFIRSDANDNVSGHTEWQDSFQVRFGNSADMRMYHNGSDNYFDSYNGHIYIRNNVDNDAGDNIYIQAKSGEHSIICNDDGSVQLYNNGTQCLQTLSGGDVRCHRHFLPDVTTSNDLGSSSLKWHDMYLQNWFQAESIRSAGTARLVLGHDGGSNNSGPNSWAQLIVEDTGEIIFGKDFVDWGIKGGQFEGNGQRQIFTTDTGHLWRTNTTNGVIVSFYSNTTFAGQIQLNSATVVAYVGGHLSRYSQFLNDERPEVVLGTVLSNLDEMCEWSFNESPDLFYEDGDILPEGKAVGDLKAIGVKEEEAGIEDNLQLNRVKISDVVGDKNVTGIFSQYEDNDVNDPHARKYDKYDDFTIAQSGDYVIRIGKDTVIERGDLLMSAGDGTAMPQDDDIVRSCTIAKVNSTSVRKVYPDGSYLVPCTLML